MVLDIPLGLVNVGPWGLLILLVALVLLGLYRRKLVPERALIDEQTEKVRWREAYERSEEARRETEKQVGELIGAVGQTNRLAEMTVSMLKALRDEAST